MTNVVISVLFFNQTHERPINDFKPQSRYEAVFNCNRIYLCKPFVYRQVFEMKECIIISLWAILNCMHLDTNGQPASAREAKSVAKQMNAHLELTPQQYRRVLEINTSAAKKMKVAIKQSDSKNTLEKSRMIILDEIDLALMEILTSRQWYEWTNLSRYLFEKQSGRKENQVLEYFSK